MCMHFCYCGIMLAWCFEFWVDSSHVKLFINLVSSSLNRVFTVPVYQEFSLWISAQQTPTKSSPVLLHYDYTHTIWSNQQICVFCILNMSHLSSCDQIYVNILSLVLLYVDGTLLLAYALPQIFLTCFPQVVRIRMWWCLIVERSRLLPPSKATPKKSRLSSTILLR